jgi:2-C-methyl-D-erythritol 4-phosphate cytidylyltransferase
VAGGSGQRFGGPKQFLPLAGRPVAAWSLRAAGTACDGVVLVVPAAGGAPAADPLPVPGDAGPAAWGADVVVAGGASRAASVRAGLAAVPDEAAVVVVHDAARPLAPASLFDTVIGAVRDQGADAAIPGVPVADTLKRVAGDRVVATVDREGLVAVQTPQAFDAAALRGAHREAGEATDDAGLLEAAGATVVVVPGDPGNLKVTRPEDLALAEALMAGAQR